jgi:4-amino-4-deoxy-L-arabinose transferase-like glycosyltransferase
VTLRTTPIYVVVTLVAILLVGYSQTRALAWDEGFHVLTAQLIAHGKRPYIDFCFSQTPVNAYWNAALLSVFGEDWRPLHAGAAVCSAFAAWLTAGFVWARFPVERWRVPGAVAALVLVGFNVAVVRYGGIAQAYGLCLLAIAAAFRFTVISVGDRTWRFSTLAGLASGIAAASSLLTAPTVLIYLLWILRYNRQGKRWIKTVSFLSGVVLAFAPVLWLFTLGPARVFFGIVQYNFSYRLLNWPGATEHNFGVYSSWIDSGGVLILILLAVTGLLFVRFRSGWTASLKAEFYLCSWVATGLAAFISYGKPTFERYYLFTVPFLAILAVAGLYAIGESLYKPDRPWIPVLVLSAFVTFGLTKDLIDVGDNIIWPDMEKVAMKVAQVTKPQQTLYADEAIYFLTSHTPPSGMEMDDSHKFNFPPTRSTFLHLIPASELERQVKSGRFDTLETCDDDDYIAEHGFAAVYANRAEVEFCNVFWNLKRK